VTTAGAVAIVSNPRHARADRFCYSRNGGALSETVPLLLLVHLESLGVDHGHARCRGDPVVPRARWGGVPAGLALWRPSVARSNSGLAHLRAPGVLRAHEEEVLHRVGFLSCRWVGWWHYGV
jgi:hypothetical protein